MLPGTTLAIPECKGSLVYPYRQPQCKVPSIHSPHPLVCPVAQERKKDDLHGAQFKLSKITHRLALRLRAALRKVAHSGMKWHRLAFSHAFKQLHIKKLLLWFCSAASQCIFSCPLKADSGSGSHFRLFHLAQEPLPQRPWDFYGT